MKNIFEKIPLFDGLSASEMADIESLFNVLKLNKRDFLFYEHDTGNHFYVVQEGYLEVIKAFGTENERLIALRGPGEFIGELSLISRNNLRTASVRAKRDTVVLEMSHENFNQMLLNKPEMAYQIAIVLGERLTLAHNITIEELQKKNYELEKAYKELLAAQEQIIESERIERELQMGYEIQMGILPQETPKFARFEISAYISPARKVGGDFYDFVELDEHRLGIFIGDVADKGIPAAIFMAQVHALIFAEARRGSRPEKVLKYVNHILSGMNASSSFVTVIYGILDNNDKTFSYARAGHELPIIKKKNAESIYPPQSMGQLIGVFDEPIFDIQTTSLEKDDVLVLYTDGMMDIQNQKDELYGIESLLKNLNQVENQTSKEISQLLINNLTKFQGETQQDDDVTLVVIRAV